MGWLWVGLQQALTQLRVSGGAPDGMTVDAQGLVWSARWDGSAPYRYTEDAVEERGIQFPAKKVSSVICGGNELSDLYVTTALTDGTKAEEGEGAGALFRVWLGVRGSPEFFAWIGI